MNRTAKKKEQKDSKLFLRIKNIENVRFFNSNITYFHFENRIFKNVDFLGCNLKHSKFYRSKFTNAVFYNVKFSNSNFEGSSFINCYFINCNFDKVKNFNFKNFNIINTDFSSLSIPRYVENNILNLNRVPAFKRAYVFTTKRSKGSKINKGMLYVLKNDFTDNEISRIFRAINKKNNSRIKNLITYGQFYEFGKRYLKK